SAVRWGGLIEGDIRDPDAVRAAIREVRPAAVLHFAALTLVGESARQPDLYRGVNVEGTRTLLEAMRGAAVDCLVFSSTCAVYGEPERVPIDEGLPRRPINVYGETKLAAEQLMEAADAAGSV